MGTFRLILAWFVLASHVIGFFDYFSLEVGQIAVASFFFISGYLMPLAYETYYSSLGFSDGFRKFCFNRFLRIYPIYWLSLLLHLTMIGINIWRGKPVEPDYFQVAPYLQNFLLLGLNQTHLWNGAYRFNNPAWTLDIELQYYLLVPFLVFFWSRAKILTNVLMILMSIGCVYLIFNPHGSRDVDFSLLAWSVYFFLGYWYYRSQKAQDIFSRRNVMLVLTVVLGAASYLVTDEKHRVLLTILAFLPLSAYLLVLQKQFKFGKWDKLAGDLSYPTYILHLIFYPFFDKFSQMVGIVSKRSLPELFLTIFANMVISGVVSYLALRFIADPIDAYRNRFKKKRIQS
jgi:peptidoglycan/LPS O-acetylase OafA/YrhL